VLLRNLVWIDVVVSWLRVRVRPRHDDDDASPPRRRASDAATEGIEAVLPFEAE
jgi:hypothetical protein